MASSLSHFPILLLFLSFTAFLSADSQSFIGVNYGQVADNLPPPSETAKLLQSTAIKRVRVSTVHSMAVLAQSDPPSSGQFNPGFQDVLKGLLAFQRDNGSPFAVNPYPFFAYQSDPRPETLAFCLFQPNAGRVDSGSGIKYMNMFDAQVDAVRSALNAVGFKDIDILITETGWPYHGDSNEVGTSVENARAYNGNLIAHLRSMVGTPLMPGKSVETYIFALYDEDLKPGPASERSFGLFKPDLTATYEVGLTKSSQTPSTPTVSPSPKPTSAQWCVPKSGVSDAQLQANLDYACGHGIDCSAIQPGGACFDPNTVASHAAYAMNLYYHTVGTVPLNCDFSQTAMLTSSNPSKFSLTRARIEMAHVFHDEDTLNIKGDLLSGIIIHKVTD
ncbi:unnamed protein product [Malus baccata var. baccata]